MNQIKNIKHIKKIILFGLIYLVIGIISAFITNPMEAAGMQAALRLLALMLAITLFVIHIRLELFQYNSSVLKSALNGAIATAIGTFLLAFLANVYNILKAGENKNQLLLSLIVWPAVTGLLSLLGGYVVAKIFSLIRSRRR
jgi:ABC-type transport system involved in cytochrome c biogenesis permease component